MKSISYRFFLFKKLFLYPTFWRNLKKSLTKLNDVLNNCENIIKYTEQSTPDHYEVMKLDGRKENDRSVLNRESLLLTFSQ
jgi:hypothetical protein